MDTATSQGAAARRRAGDADDRPRGLPSPWDGLPWKPMGTARHRGKARLYVAVDGARRVVCKDASFARGLLSRPMRRRMIRRESAMLRRLDAVPGVPRLLVDWSSGLVMEHVPGVPLRHWAADEVLPASFDALDALIDAVHACDVVIGDLNRYNILIGDRGEVHLVDFELALDVGRLPWRVLADHGRRLDRLAAARQRRRCGAPLGAAHEALLARTPLAYRGYRRLKKAGRALLGRRRRERQGR